MIASSAGAVMAITLDDTPRRLARASWIARAGDAFDLRLVLAGWRNTTLPLFSSVATSR